MNKKNYKKLVIILSGPPGSGKGTQAGLLAEEFNLYYLETSKILEETFQKAKKGEAVKIGKKRFDLLAEKKLWQKGILCSPPFVSHLIKKKIKELFKTDQNLVLAGSPRTLYEGKEIVPLLKKLYGKKNIKIILITLSLKESIFRNSHRRICQLFRHPVLWNKETKNLTLCPLDGSKLTKRTLDKPRVIRVRWQEYQERTFPLVDLFKKQGLKVKKVNGEQSVAKVFQSILKVLRKN
jgi:adenylate kinase